MSAQDWSAIVYPSVAVVLFLISVSYLFLCWVNPKIRASVSVRFLYFFIDSISFALVSLAAGENPFIPIALLRHYVVASRVVMLLAAVYLLVVTVLEVISRFRPLPYPWNRVVSDLHRDRN